MIGAAGRPGYGQLRGAATYCAEVFGPLTLLAIGLGTVIVRDDTAATAECQLHMAGLASGLVNTTRQLGGAVGLAVMATIAGRATTPTVGYDHAFWISAAALTIGAAVALTLPGKPNSERHIISREEIAEPAVLVEA